MGFQIRPVPDFRRARQGVVDRHQPRQPLHVPGAVQPSASRSSSSSRGRHPRAVGPQHALRPRPRRRRPARRTTALPRRLPSATRSPRATAPARARPASSGTATSTATATSTSRSPATATAGCGGSRQAADGTTTLHRLTDPGEYFGQAGGAVVADFDGDGVNEMVFSSFDQNTVAVWTRDRSRGPEHPRPPTPTRVTVPSSLRVGPETRTVKAGRKATWSSGSPAPRRPRGVPSRWSSTRRRARTSRSATLAPRPRPRRRRPEGQLQLPPEAKGRFVVTYAGTTVNASLRDTAARRRRAGHSSAR